MDNWEKDTDEFVYDKEHLYDALVRSTDDYIYIGNMKTGTFRYAPGMVKDFALPGANRSQRGCRLGRVGASP